MGAPPFVEIFSVPPLGCNCTIVGDMESKKAVVVDPGGNVNVIFEKLTKAGLKCEKILITHGHLDHILGAEELKRLTNADIIMNQEDLSLYQNVNGQCRDFGVALPEAPLPDIDAFIADNDEVKVATNLSFKAMHCPGHTPGSTTYIFPEAELACAGDTLFKGSIGRTSWAGIPSLDGTSDSNKLYHSIKQKMAYIDPNFKVVAGHGDCTTMGYELVRNPHLR